MTPSVQDKAKAEYVFLDYDRISYPAENTFLAKFVR